jgi:hypothetical protein
VSSRLKTNLPMHNCQFIIGMHGEPGKGPQVDYCDRPASIKHQGFWLCPEHYDLMESDDSLSIAIPDEKRKLAKNSAFRYMYS